MINREQFLEKDYDEVRKSFSWSIPGKYNIADDCCDRIAREKPDKVALYVEDEKGKEIIATYGQLKELSDRFANFLVSTGIKKGDRVAIVLPQRLETVVAHLGVYKVGAIAVPLSILFGADALTYRLNDSGARVAVIDSSVSEKFTEIKEGLQYLEKILVVGEPVANDMLGFQDLLAKSSPHFKGVDTESSDPAIIIYTSGTTGNPKGALHAHRVLLGHIPGFQLFFDFAPQPGDVFWTPADWAWIGGAFDLLFPGLKYGGPVIGSVSGKFDPERAFHLMAKYKVTCTFMPATALKMLMQVPKPGKRYDLQLRAIGSGGEAVNPVIHEWYRENLDVPVNEFYGQTEANLLVGYCSQVLKLKPGSMGKPFPGHKVDLIDEKGNALPPGELGEIALDAAGDPVVFLEYWNNREATTEKFIGRWLATGDMAVKDEEGYLVFNGRKDDVINSAGYRIGPTEVESSLLQHPAVAEAAAIGVPDELRGEVVKGFVKLKSGYVPSEKLKKEIQDFVKTRLSAYAYPREIEFIDELPLTTTGKVKRRELRELERSKRKN